MGFTSYYLVKNISDNPISCTKNLVGWSDTDIRDENRDRKSSFTVIPPHTTYKIPVQMHMSSRYKFSKSGYFVVFSEDVFEVHAIKVKSNFQRNI